MRCQEVTQLGVAYLNGEVSASERHLIQLHLAECENCQRELASLATLQKYINQSLKQIAAPVQPHPRTWHHLQAKLPQRNSPLSGRSFATNLSAWLHSIWKLGSITAALFLLITVTTFAIRLLPQGISSPATAVGFNLTQGMFDDVRDLDWSYNGRIVFAARSDKAPYHLYTINPDGSDVYQLTNAATDDTSPHWSPNGIQIAYLAVTPEKTDLMTIYRNGSHHNDLTSNLPGNVENFAWSLNGTEIAYVSKQNGSSDLKIVNYKDADSSASCLTYQPDVVGSPVWMPTNSPVWIPKSDSKNDYLLFSAPSPDKKNLDIYQVNSCKADLLPERLTESIADDFNIQWDPHGEKFLYQSGPDIYVMDYKTLTSALLIPDGFAAAISPNGSMLAFQSGRSGTNQLFIMMMKSNQKDNLLFLEQPGLIEQAPVWSADEQYLAFTIRSDLTGKTDIFIVNVKDFTPWRPQP